MNCVFCGIVSGEIPSNIIYQDDQVIAFPDIHPLAPKHILIIPRRHITRLEELGEGEQSLLGHLLWVGRQLAQGQGIDQSGYRLVINNGPDGGQLVPHLHLHLLGGRRLEDKLG